MVSPILAFSLNLVAGRVKGFESLKVDRPITFDYDIKKADFPITDQLYSTYRQFANEKYKIAGTITDTEREFVERLLRSELVTAAYGSQTSLQVLNEYDTTLLKGIDLMPQAKAMALEALKTRSSVPQRKQPTN